jgi:hypothetical protein
MPDYQLSKIYKLHCILENDDEPLVYYGSTTEPYLSNRLSKHKDKYRNYLKNKYNFVTSFKLFDKYKLDNVLITLIELFPCNSKVELQSRERYFIENNKCVNKNIPTRTDKEYREANKEQLIIKSKEYREANKEQINKNNICICGGKYNNSVKARHIKSNKHITYLNSLNNNI